MDTIYLLDSIEAFSYAPAIPGVAVLWLSNFASWDQRLMRGRAQSRVNIWERKSTPSVWWWSYLQVRHGGLHPGLQIRRLDYRFGNYSVRSETPFNDLSHCIWTKIYEAAYVYWLWLYRYVPSSPLKNLPNQAVRYAVVAGNVED